MDDVTKLYLSAMLSTAVGGDAWYLVGGPDGFALEGRFEDDRGALGCPPWVDTPYCVERGSWGAACRLPLSLPLADDPPDEYRFVPAPIWAIAREELRRHAGGAEPGAAPDSAGR